MKKITKIFTALLTLCLLCGVILSVVASAAGDELVPLLNVTEHDKNLSYTMENGDNIPISAKAGNVFEKSLSGVNSYFRIATNDDYTKGNNSTNAITFTAVNVQDYQYVTIDFDIGTDRYVYWDSEGKPHTTPDLSEAQQYENYRLAYSDIKPSYGMGIFHCRFGGKDATKLATNYDATTGRYYIWSGSGNKIYLSNEIGMFDHITIVAKITKKDAANYNVKQYAYVNGEYLAKVQDLDVTTATVAFNGVRINAFSNSKIHSNVAYNCVAKGVNGETLKSGNSYSIIYDNLAINYYTNDYDYAEENGLNKIDLTQSIYNCPDVVYNVNYNINPYVQIGENGVKNYYSADVNEALASIKNGDTVYTTRDILDFTPPEGIERFELLFPNGAPKFTLSSEAAKAYKVQESILGYEVIKLGLDANDKMTTIQWLDADNNLLMQETLPVGVTPAYSPVTINTFDFENKTITKFSVEAWMWDIDGEGNELLNRDPMAIRALTGEEIDLANQYCNGVIKIYPVGVTEKETVDMAYIILNGDSVVLDTARSYLAYENSATLVAQLSAAPNGASAILYKDASVANTVSVSANKNISIDLNGNTVTVSAAKAFNIAASSSVNIYSSVANAEFISPMLIDGEAVSGELVIGANCYFAEKLGDYKASVKLADNVISAIAGTDVPGEIATVTLNLQDYVAEDFALVVWQDVLGDEFAKEYYHKSYTFVSHPAKDDMNDIQKFPKAAEGDSGWFDIGYTDWKSATDGVDLQTLVMGKTNVFVPTFGPVPYFDIKVNASIRYTDVSINICLPVPEAESKVVFDALTGVYMIGEDEAREYVALSEITIDGEQYYVINLPISLDSFDTPTVFVEFGVLGFADEPIILEKEISFNFMTYAESIAEVYACGSDDAKVVFDLVLYKYEAYLNAVGEDADAELVERVESFLKGHGDSGCACITDLDAVEFSEDELLATLLGDEALAEKILYAGFEVDTDRPYLYFYLPEDVEVKSFTVTHFGLEHMLGGWEYINNKVTADLTYAGTAEYNGQICNVYQYADLMLCNAASIMNIKLDVVAIPASDDIFEVVEVYEGQFSLAAYINGLSESDAEIAPLAKALYVASKSAYEYRIIRSDEVE